MKNITTEITKEEFFKMKKHDRVIYIYEKLNDCKILVEGDGRLFIVNKDGSLEQIKYADMLKVYNLGVVAND